MPVLARLNSAIPTGTAVAATLFVLLAASTPEAQSGSARYRFTTLIDSQDGLVPTRARPSTWPARWRCKWRIRSSASTSW